MHLSCNLLRSHEYCKQERNITCHTSRLSKWAYGPMLWLLSRTAQFQSRFWHSTPWGFHGFPQFLQIMPGQYLKIGHDHFLHSLSYSYSVNPIKDYIKTKEYRISPKLHLHISQLHTCKNTFVITPKTNN